MVVNKEVERLTRAVTKALRKREAKTIHQLATECGTTRQHLARIMSDLVGSGVAVRHRGKPPTYTKA